MSKINKNQKLTILLSMAEEARFQNALSNWHLSEFFLDLVEEFNTKNNNDHDKQRRFFNRYANKLVEIGVLEKATKVALGEGMYSEFGCRTETLWACNFNLTKEEAEELIITSVESGRI